MTAGDYWLKVGQPPRSVVFTWDTSGSTAAMRPVMRQALMRYVEDVKPDIDEAHMLPFGGGFLSRQWLDQPYMLQTALNDYNGAGNSSAAETALVQATEKLASREGQKVIVVLTDAATSRDARLWRTLGEVRPSIIALGVSSKGAFSSVPKREQDLMQDWAASAEGYYEYVENVGSLSRAFDRASSRIRKPAVYGVTASSRYEDPPSPGFLEVVTRGTGSIEIDLPDPAIELILDASGSMLQRLNGERRYLIARNVLTDLVANKLPDNVRLGLRVFGHKEAGSCRTDLELPVAPIDRDKVKNILGQVVPKNLAKTPIAASLQAAGSDLAGQEGEKTILLITDGEETCDGDVSAAIESLRSRGFDTVTNIIGFAVDDSELTAKFKAWAQAGNGSYRQAGDKDALRASVEQLTARRFDVFNSANERVTSGTTDSDPLELLPGTYRVVFERGTEVNVNITSAVTTTATVR